MGASRAGANDDASVAPAPNAAAGRPTATSPAASPSFSSNVHRGRTWRSRRTWASRAAVAWGSIASTRHSRPGVSATGAASISAATALAAATAAVTGMTSGGDENRGGGGAIGAPAQCVSSSFTPAVVASGGGFFAGIPTGIPTGGGSPGRWPTGTAGAVGAPNGSCAPFEGGSGAPWPPSIAPVVLRSDADPRALAFQTCVRIFTLVSSLPTSSHTRR